MADVTEAERIALRKVLDESTEERVREIVREEMREALVCSAEEIEKAIIEHIRLAKGGL